MQHKISGFLMAESCVALSITFLGIVSISLIVSESRSFELENEQKVDRTYAMRAMKENGIKQIIVHDHVYQMIGDSKIYDATKKQTYKVKK